MTLIYVKFYTEEEGPLIHQLQTVVYWTTVALTDNGEFEFNSGESAWEFALTTKVGSRSENFSNGQCSKRWQTVLTAVSKLLIEMRTM